MQTVESPKPKPRIFRSRRLPRNKYDLRLLLFILPISIAVMIPLAIVWMILPMVIAMRLTGSIELAMGLMFTQWLLWMGTFVSPIVNQLEIQEEGLVAPGTFKTLRITWDDIESVRIVTSGEMIKASLRWPFIEPGLRFSNSPFTFCQYIRIKHKHGTLYYAAEETEELFTLLLNHRQSRNNTDTRWYNTTVPTSATEAVQLGPRRR